MCAYRVIGAKNINGVGSEDLGARCICVYACDCGVDQRLRSEVPTSKRKMGQIACTGFSEFTECVIDPPQNVSKESEQKEAEMLPERGALRLKETSEMPSKGEGESFLKGLLESMEKIKKNNQRAAEDLCRTDEMLESIRRAREAEEAESVAWSAARRVPGVELTQPETMCRREPEGGEA